MKRDPQNKLVHSGVYVGDDLETYLQAARLSREVNIITFDKAGEENRRAHAGR